MFHLVNIKSVHTYLDHLIFSDKSVFSVAWLFSHLLLSHSCLSVSFLAISFKDVVHLSELTAGLAQT